MNTVVAVATVAVITVVTAVAVATALAAVSATTVVSTVTAVTAVAVVTAVTVVAPVAPVAVITVLAAAAAAAANVVAVVTSGPQVVTTLYIFVVPPHSRRDTGSASLGGGMGWGGNTGGRLSSTVLGEDGARRELALPLAAAYSAIDAVEGLDVDAIEAEHFEKFGLRGQINTLLLQLWRLDDCRPAVVRAAQQPSGSAEHAVLTGLANAMLDTLLYQVGQT